MWSQRIYGMEYCSKLEKPPKYLLVCDDDVEFPENFVEQLVNKSEAHNADVMNPIRDVRLGLKTRIFHFLIGGRIESSRSEYKISIRPNCSFAVNNELKNDVNPTQSGHFPCFLMKTSMTHALKLRDEMWLDETRYAWPDDQVFFYKAFILGFNIMSCKTPIFKHLDGKSGVTDKDRVADHCYSAGHNSYIFWYRFIRRNPRWSAFRKNLSFGYTKTVMKLLYAIKGMQYYKAYTRGLADGMKYCKNDESKTIFTTD